ncbi:syntaxin-61 [Senna tora]|uniref:Syntaxin-61 n=1 Tax=Senna tora TaxID=362788 RepID=A0A834U2M6_9FABA|nr:syntaxin-61 [Senna tora]
MPLAQDPFYVVKEEIQESIDKLQSTFQQWQNTPSDAAERVNLSKELLPSCESIEWQVDELDKAIAVAARDPSWYGIDEKELESRRRWTSNARTQVGTVKKTVEAGKGSSMATRDSAAMHRELMRLPNSHQVDVPNQYDAQDNDDFISSESDRQLLLIRYFFPLSLSQQDEELDELSASVQRIGGVGLTIHEELLAQEKIMDELGAEMDSTSNRLDFVQKKVAMVMKKAGAKGQIMMILALVVLFVFLFILVFFT